VRECKGKGIKKSKLKEMEAKTDAELVESIKDISKQRTAQSQDENNKKYIWIIVSSILAILIIVAIVFLVKEKRILK
jgi:type IV secretory pathway component VirB8